MRENGNNIQDQYEVYEVTKPFKTEIVDKTDYLTLKKKELKDYTELVKSVPVKPVLEKIDLKGAFYTSENSLDEFDCFQQNFSYTETKLALQTLSIPLKFRREINDGTSIPNQVETGVNVGFAPVIKYTFNKFDPHRKIMGKTKNQYSINSGILLNLGATDLKGASNAPGIAIDRKAATFTYGTFLMFGVNNINFGYAIGWDTVIGDGASNWVYQNRLWQGLIVALDIIKP
ncbi:MAG: hypothetical protein ABGX00_09125 [Allomuricauda sp.]